MRYEERVTQYKINRMFVQNLKKFINRYIVSKISLMKDQMLKKVKNFGLTWDNEKEHETNAEC